MKYSPPVCFVLIATMVYVEVLLWVAIYLYTFYNFLSFTSTLFVNSCILVQHVPLHVCKS